jgi:hypothetical protein
VNASTDRFACGVEWIEESPQPLAMSPRTRSDFLAHTVKRFGEGLPSDTCIRIERVFVTADHAIVTLWFLPLPVCLGHVGYRYWWICER